MSGEMKEVNQAEEEKQQTGTLKVAELSEGPFRLETGKIARQADGAVIVTFGKTKVLATVTRGEEALRGGDPQRADDRPADPAALPPGL